MFKKVRAALGLDRCRIIISGAAPIMRETIEFFLSLDVLLMEAYGMSEASGSRVVPNRGVAINLFWGYKSFFLGGGYKTGWYKTVE